MNLFQWGACAIGVVFVVYLIARVASAGFFETKRQYEERKN